MVFALLPATLEPSTRAESSLSGASMRLSRAEHPELTVLPPGAHHVGVQLLFWSSIGLAGGQICYPARRHAGRRPHHKLSRRQVAVPLHRSLVSWHDHGELGQSSSMLTRKVADALSCRPPPPSCVLTKALRACASWSSAAEQPQPSFSIRSPASSSFPPSGVCYRTPTLLRAAQFCS